MTNALVQFWRKAPLDVPPYTHPEDFRVLNKYCPRDLLYRQLDAVSFQELGVHQSDKNFFHFSLLPIPYVGNLQTADIFILMLNPGFAVTEYEWEAGVERQHTIRRNCHQEFSSSGHPFFLANTEWRSHPGYHYWKSCLRWVGDFEDFAQRLAIIQMVPYHSAKFGNAKLVEELPSARMAREYVQTELLTKAKSGEVLLIVKRQVKNWGLEDMDACENIFSSRNRSEARCKYYSDNTRDGRMILKWIEKHPR